MEASPDNGPVTAFIDRWERSGAAEQEEMEGLKAETGKLKTETRKHKQTWPKSLPDQVRVLREALTAQPTPTSAEAIARQFTRARTDKVEELLQALVTLGQAQKLDAGLYSGGA